MEKAAKFEMDFMSIDDLDDIITIENASFPSPWSKRIFEKEIKASNSYKRVVRMSGMVVGYIVTWIIRDEIHILNVAVHPDFRNIGIGEKLIRDCINYSSEENLRYAILEVRISNMAAKRLYEKIGFKGMQLRKKYYSDTGEDAIVMAYEIL